MNGCDQFAVGSRSRKLCEEGTHVGNRFRAKHGLPPLELEQPAIAVAGVPNDRQLVQIQDRPRPKLRGLGDVVARGIELATFGKIKKCGGCNGRAAVLNHYVPAKYDPVLPVSLGNATRHLTFHIWPNHTDSWKWNCDKLLENAELFNGRRIVAIANGATDSAEAVKEYLKGFTDDFIVIPNNKALREVATWVPMLEKIEQYQSESDVTFSCHAKGVRHNLDPEDSEGSTIFKWTEAMYELCLDWQSVRSLLESYGTAGSFRRYVCGGKWGPWHYSGSFFWWRNRDAYARNWRYTPKAFFGTEAWPGLMFTERESGVLLFDNVQDLYKMKYWQESIEPVLQEWRKKRVSVG